MLDWFGVLLGRMVDITRVEIAWLLALGIVYRIRGLGGLVPCVVLVEVQMRVEG